jgi:hypothetical protein
MLLWAIAIIILYIFALNEMLVPKIDDIFIDMLNKGDIQNSQKYEGHSTHMAATPVRQYGLHICSLISWNSNLLPKALFDLS